MKKGIGIGFLMVIVLIFVSCKREKEQNNIEETKKEHITLWSYYETNAQQDSLDKLIQNFNRSQDQYDASWEYVPMTEFNKRLAIGVMGEELPDMVIIDNPDMSSYVNLGLFEDITDFWNAQENQEEYYPEVLKTVCYNERYYGIPFSCNNVALIYNKDLLEREGVTPPSNWEEFFNAAQKLTNGNRYGFVMSAVEGEQSAFQVLPWILSAGEDLNNLGNKKTEKAFSLIEKLIGEGVMDANCVNWSQNDIARKFIAGEAVMMENGPWILPMLKEAGISYGIVPLPMDEKKVVITGGENLGIIKGKNKKGAISFIEYFSQDFVMEKTCVESNVLPPKINLAKKVAQDQEDYKEFVLQMDTAISRVTLRNWSQMSKALSESMYYNITGEMNSKEAARHIQKARVN